MTLSRSFPLRRAAAPLAGALLVLLPALAAADSEGDEQRNQSVQHSTSITISPLLLVLPVVELTAERRFADKIGAGVILGAGSVTPTETTTDSQGKSVTTEGPALTVLEGGATFRYYPVGNFVHGMQLGAELVYLKVLGDAGNGVSLSGTGLSAGPFIGYKIAANVGFTFEVQLGAQYAAASATASKGSATASETDSTWGPLLNLNLGWSF